jgi:hypothetical protein
MRAEGMHHDWPVLFVVRSVAWLVWAIATPLVMRMERLRGRRRVLIHLVVCLLLGLISAAWVAGLETLFNPWADPSPPAFLSGWKAGFLQTLPAYAVLYGTLIALGFALRTRQQMARQRELLVQAQLDALRRQIEPHFLFNSLNAVVSLIREGRSSDAIEVTVELGDLLRRVLDEQGRQLVPLFEELDFLGKYLDIQKVRFGDRLDVKIVKSPELAMARVPALLLQPLAENAIKHGIGRRVEGGTLDIKVDREKDRLAIRVENDGPPLPATIEDGIGLANVRARLHSLYGKEAALDIGEGAPGKVLVTVSLPYRIE